MDGRRAARLVQTVLRCYPARWRRRHGDEAAELAALLIRDGTPAGSIARSYLAGAAREWLTPRPGRRPGAMACALLVAACSLGVSAGLLASAAPARAASAGSASARAGSTRAASTSQAGARPSQAGDRPSQARTHAHCRPASPGPVPGALPATGHARAIVWEAGHGRSC